MGGERLLFESGLYTRAASDQANTVDAAVPLKHQVSLLNVYIHIQYACFVQKNTILYSGKISLGFIFITESPKTGN